MFYELIQVSSFFSTVVPSLSHLSYLSFVGVSTIYYKVTKIMSEI